LPQQPLPQPQPLACIVFMVHLLFSLKTLLPSRRRATRGGPARNQIIPRQAFRQFRHTERCERDG
jgi:hypothetical protein